MKIIGIIAARLDSKRLPTKALINIEGNPLIYYTIKRALEIRGVSQIVLATTDRIIDDPLVNYAQQLGLEVFRGNLENVALRCLKCAKAYGADFFIRINADSPFIDPRLIEYGLTLMDDLSIDLVTNLIGRSFPYGISVEIINVENFERLVPRLSISDAEHTTKYFYDNPQEFKIKAFFSTEHSLINARIVVDTQNDLNIFKQVVKQLGANVMSARYDEVARLYLASN